MAVRILLSPRGDPPVWTAAGEPLAFHRRLPGYAPTPLLDLGDLAADLGLGAVWVKHEAERFGLPAFKILGASYAVFCRCVDELGPPPPWETVADLRAWAAPLRPLTLLAATDGNHGRAVARSAALLGFHASIFVPAGTAQARIDAIAGEGAVVTVVDGSYDDAVALAAAGAGPRDWVIADTAWPGYEETPRRVVAGYSTMLAEADSQIAGLGRGGPDLVLAQVGVGALAAALVLHYRAAGAGPRIVGVEPLDAACLLESVDAGRIVSVPGPHRSIMVGLNCGTPSLVAWPLLERGVDAWTAIDDGWTRAAVRLLADHSVAAGETGAAGLAGLLALLRAPEASEARAALGLGPACRVLLIVTEGVTDPTLHQEILRS
ncbi:MAG TPA: diaminopropionate ammonia-lyase [Roseiflexaceae bacterium]|nr:diaminopropionate ammonia-lyase [Roseiflexaceae bacterium]